ncbi:hypothetical protein [Desulfovibrio cuneatus]|uniref:hypothetical protein n=1 Tax=Desulfovibrio cuneatus TaxID=159728 RepID=UPI00146FB2C1|nr:hypothetical protein [Desulfovibrio cuneatus]
MGCFLPGPGRGACCPVYAPAARWGVFAPCMPLPPWWCPVCPVYAPASMVVLQRAPRMPPAVPGGVCMPHACPCVPGGGLGAGRKKTPHGGM